MNAPATITPITVTPEALDRAGLRLELAAANLAAWKPSGDDDRDEATFGRVDAERDAARKAYRAMIEILTGDSADVVERRMVL